MASASKFLLSKRTTRAALFCFAVAGTAACNEDTSDAGGAEPPAVAENTLAQLQAFGKVLTRFYSSTFLVPQNIESLLSRLPLVVFGELTDVSYGRKECLGTCELDGQKSLQYSSHINLVIHARQTLAGTLHGSDPNVYVELHWPNNLNIDALTDASPTGARVIVIGEPVANTAETTGPLVEAGIVSKDSVRENIVALPDYGLIFESDQGVTVLPLLDCVSLDELVQDGDARLQRFDEAQQVISDVLKN